MAREYVFISTINASLVEHFPELSRERYDSVFSALVNHEHAPRMWKSKTYHVYGANIKSMAVGIMAADLADLPIIMLKINGLMGNALFSARDVLKEQHQLCELRLAGIL